MDRRSGEAILVLNDEGKIAYWNPGAHILLGYDAREARGRSLYKLLGVENGAAFRKEAKEMLRHRKAAKGIVQRFTVTDREGRRFPAELLLSPLKTKNGWQTIGILRDESRRSVTEWALVASERKYRQVLETTAEGFWRLDGEGKMAEVNPALCRMLGKPREELLGEEAGRFLENHHVPPDREGFLFYQSVLSDGEERQVPVIVNATSAEEGSFAFFTDITGHRAAQARLDHHRKLLDGVSTAVVRLITNQNVEEALQEVLGILGRTAGVRQVSLYEHRLEEEGFIARRQAFWSEEEAAPPEEWIREGDDQWNRWYEGVCRQASEEMERRNDREAPLPPDEQYSVDAYLVLPVSVRNRLWGILLLDGGNRPRVWSRREKATLYSVALSIAGVLERENHVGEIARLNATLLQRVEEEVEKNRMKDRLMFQQSRYAQMGEMLSMIAHQWRQPLSAISTEIIDLSIKRELDACTGTDIDKAAGFIEEQTSKMSEIIDDFMTFFSPEKSPEYFSPFVLVRQIFKLVSAQLVHRKIGFENRIAPEIQLKGYKKELEQVLVNLITNARDAFTDGEEKEERMIVVESALDGEKTLIRVRDNAGGVPDPIMERIFDPYFTTKEQGQGTGIGLYMCKTIVERSFGGKIRVENFVSPENGKEGALFTVCLPGGRKQ